MWVRVMEWMLVDDEPPMPVAGSWLRSVGVRISGVVSTAASSASDGLARIPDAESADRHRVRYALTGTASNARDVRVGFGRRKQSRHAGAEFVLTVGALRFQVECSGHASEVPMGSYITVSGELVLVGDYEWDDFELTDTRRDWRVKQVANLCDADVLVELEHPRDD